MLRTPVPRTLGVPPVVAGGLALGAGAALLWLQRKAHEKAMEMARLERTFRADALYRRPNYKGMTSQQLNAAAALLDRWGRDVYQDPLTGTLIERRAVDAERFKRAGGGGFIFIPPPVAAPAISPAVAWAIGGLIAGGVKLAVGLTQFWGRFRPAPPGAWPPDVVPGPRATTGRIHLELVTPGESTGTLASTIREVLSESMELRSGANSDYYWLEVVFLSTTGKVATAAGSVFFERGMRAQFVNKSGTVVDPGVTLPPLYPAEVPLPAETPDTEPRRTPVPLPAPPSTPQPEPEFDPVPAPEPGPPQPIAPPVPVPTIPEAIPAKPGRVIVIRPDGSLPEPEPEPPPQTHPDWHYPIPGGKPVTGNGPQAKPQEIAKELGRLEAKLNAVLNPVQDLLPSWQKILQLIAEALYYSTQGTTYTLTEPCTVDPGEVPRSITVDAPGAFTSLGVIQNRVDALAELLQGHKDLRQPTCSVKPVLTGEWVTVNFKSDERSPMGDKPLRKYLRYRDQTFAEQEVHVSHWEKFVWQAGPVWVASKNLSWGTPSCWAATADEGKRVLRHAAQVAGVDLTDPKHEWVISGSNDPRYGQPGTMRVDTRGGRFVRVTKRPGPNGLPIGRPPKP